MIQIVDKYGNTSTDSANVIVIDKNGIVKKIDVGGATPTGPAGGDLSGTYPNPTVTWSNGSPTYDLLYYPLSTNPSGFLTSATAALTYYPIPTGTTSEYIRGDGSIVAFPTIFVLPSLTSGSVLFSDGTTIAQDNANFFWDDTNNRLGIGTNIPSSSLHIAGSGSFSGLHLQNLTAASLGVPQNTPSITLTGASFQSPSSAISQWRILGVGSSGASYSHELYFQSITGPSQTVQTPARLSQNGSLTLTNVLSAFSLSTFSGYAYGTGSNTATSGTTNYISTTGTFNPTSGTAILNYNNIAPTINQTGGANGITRGLYINPTLTSAFDFRAIETTVGNVMLNTTSGNTLIGTSTNAGFKLDVNGTIRAHNSSFTGGITLRQTANNTSVINGGPSSENITFGPSNVIFLNAPAVNVSTNLAVVGNISTTNTSGLTFNNSTTIQNNSTRNGLIFQTQAWQNNGAGGASTINAVSISPNVNMTLGTTIGTVLLVNPTINTTGGTNTLRGIFYNPTLTSLTGTTHRAIETVTGDVIFNSTSGSTLIGTTTNAGFKLDVSGTGRFSGNLTINNDMVINSSGDRSITWGLNDLRLVSGTTNVARFFTNESRFLSSVTVAASASTSIGASFGGISANNVNYSTTFFASPYANHLQSKMIIAGQDGAYGGNGSTQGVGLFIYGGNNTTNNSYGNVVIGHDGTTKRGNVLIGTSTNVASAIVNIQSTTQGFLPPRMTNAERLAIATPAVGLCVYCTDAVEGLYINKSTGWTFIG